MAFRSNLRFDIDASYSFEKVDKTQFRKEHFSDRQTMVKRIEWWCRL